ncbi:MAG: glycoside hydrolase family 1 protein [Myxococcales bacterium]|nr:glycoside hydrolase family 1 protein [Myxococcales bacterium]
MTLGSRALTIRSALGLPLLLSLTACPSPPAANDDEADGQSESNDTTESDTGPALDYAFPEGFVWGFAVAGFQAEPGCPTLAPAQCEDPNSDWYQWVSDPELIADPSTHLSGDPLSAAPGMAELYDADFARAGDELHLGIARLSIEWSRLFPDGAAEAATSVDELAAFADPEAVAYYHDLFASARGHGLDPDQRVAGGHGVDPHRTGGHPQFELAGFVGDRHGRAGVALTSAPGLVDRDHRPLDLAAGDVLDGAADRHAAGLKHDVDARMLAAGSQGQLGAPVAVGLAQDPAGRQEGGGAGLDGVGHGPQALEAIVTVGLAGHADRATVLVEAPQHGGAGAGADVGAGDRLALIVADRAHDHGLGRARHVAAGDRQLAGALALAAARGPCLHRSLVRPLAVALVRTTTEQQRHHQQHRRDPDQDRPLVSTRLFDSRRLRTWHETGAASTIGGAYGLRAVEISRKNRSRPAALRADKTAEEPSSPGARRPGCRRRIRDERPSARRCSAHRHC